MIAIVNVDENWGIGKEGDQPFYIPEDLKFFKEKTLGKVIIMGRATLEALPNAKPLPARTNIVLTRQSDFEVENATVCHSFNELFELVKTHDAVQVFVIGGADIYKNLLPYCNKAYITKIYASADCDRYFPNLDEEKEWEMTEFSDIKNHDGIKFQFCTYERI